MHIPDPLRSWVRRLGLAVGLVAVAAAAPLCAGVLSGAEDCLELSCYEVRKKRAVKVSLHQRIHEISGLATGLDGRLFAHDDERAVIYEVDPGSGSLVKAFALGDPVVEADFEGLAVEGDRFYLVTSAGVIYVGGEGEDGARVRYARMDSGVGAGCEVEGLAFDPSPRALVLACKQPRDDRVWIHRWSLETKELSGSPLSVRVSKLARGIPGKTFHPSGVERHPVTGSYYLVAARELALAEVRPNGKVASVRSLPESVHRQVEGIAFAKDLSLLLADEGGSRRARLTRYPRGS